MTEDEEKALGKGRRLVRGLSNPSSSILDLGSNQRSTLSFIRFSHPGSGTVQRLPPSESIQ